ncbi:MAG: hypothetical protein WD048_09960 [Chitinophagales bacterium]
MKKQHFLNLFIAVSLLFVLQSCSEDFDCKTCNCTVTERDTELDGDGNTVEVTTTRTETFTACPGGDNNTSGVRSLEYYESNPIEKTEQTIDGDTYVDETSYSCSCS